MITAGGAMFTRRHLAEPARRRACHADADRA
jgi:hypothetical protein